MRINNLFKDKASKENSIGGIIFLIVLFNGCAPTPMFVNAPTLTDLKKDYPSKVINNNYDKAIDYIGQNKYNEAFLLLKPLAENNDARAQFELGNLYRYGRGVEKDSVKASNWYSKAFSLNKKIISDNRFNFFSKDSVLVTEAYNGLGEAYNYAAGVERDWGEARSWYLKAAENGHPNGQYQVGHFYSSGTMGYPSITYLGLKSYDRAYYWLNKAAAQGHPEAQSELFSMYAEAYEKDKLKVFYEKNKEFFHLN